VSKPAGTVAGHIPSVLALPCKVYGAPEVAFLTDAVPGTISTLLAQVEGMDTKVPPTSFEVEKVKGDLAMLAELYQVSSFIVTSITTSPGRFALNVQLVDAATRKVRWGKQYKGPREAYDELARQAAEGIRQVFSPSAAPVPTSPASSEADLAFREGLYFSNNYNNRHQLADFDLASRAFTRTLELDPKFARAAAEIAMLHVFRWEAGAIADKDSEVRQVESWAQKAIQLDPGAGEGWSALAEAENIGGGDLERMVEHGLKGASLAPRYAIAHQMLCYVLRTPGSESLALAAAQHAREINPLYLYASVSVARGLMNTGEPQEALRVIDQVRALEPGWKMVLPLKAQVLTKLRRFSEAADALREYTPSPDEADLSEGWRQAGLALALAEGDDARVKSLMVPLSGLLSSARGDVCVKCYIAAAAYSVAPGLARTLRTDDALRILLRSVELGPAPSYDFLLQEPGFRPLKSDPRFAKVLAGSRDEAARTAKILEQSRARGELPKYLETPLNELLRLLNQ
jgi:tetratricopeptide (TPR) repeat protein